MCTTPFFYLCYSQEKAKKEAEKRVKNFQKIQKKQDKVLVLDFGIWWLLFGKKQDYLLALLGARYKELEKVKMKRKEK